MSRVVFILGRPGSGKSSAARYIADRAEVHGLSAVQLNDYDILRTMFLADTEHKQFRPTPNNGFDVLDFSVLNTVLRNLEEKVANQSATAQIDLFLIEFARDDHCQALKVFSDSFLRSSYVLFIDTDVDTCLMRIHRRVSHPTTIDDHPSLSDDLFRIYYGKEDARTFSYRLQGDYHLAKLHMTVVDNKGSWRSFIREIKRFATDVLEIRDSTPILYRIVSFGQKKLRKTTSYWPPSDHKSGCASDAEQVSMPPSSPTATRV